MVLCGLKRYTTSEVGGHGTSLRIENLWPSQSAQEGC